MPVLDPDRLIVAYTSKLASVHRDARIPKAELDLSGGIDSAVMACLLTLSLGPENVILVHSRINTNPEQTDRAKALAAALECPLNDINLDAIYASLVKTIQQTVATCDPDAYPGMEARIAADPTILGSIRSTLRAPVGRAFNRMLGGGLRHGTGNEDEDRTLRFFQKGGDGEVDSNPIAILSKGEVYQLAVALGKWMGPAVAAALRPIILATPSPDLWGNGDGHSDEAELKKWLGVNFTYSRVDPDTGEYTHFGTIERCARFEDYLDEEEGEESLYWDEVHEGYRFLNPDRVMKGFAYRPIPYFGCFTKQEVGAFLRAWRRADESTYHKMNPNIPTYLERWELLEDGILTDEPPACAEE